VAEYYFDRVGGAGAKVIPMLSDLKQQLSEYDDRAEKLGRRL
jgi:hypothetical protein